MPLDRRTLLLVARARTAMQRERKADLSAMTAWIAREMGELRQETALARAELVSARAELRRWQEIAAAKGVESREVDALLH
jgi:hypothetical protein